MYLHAAGAMFITSFTTMVAFLSNVTSPLLGVSSFGTFSALLVFVNYCSVILFLPTVLITYEFYWKDWEWPCFKVFNVCARIPSDNQVAPSPTRENEEKADAAQDIPGQTPNRTHKMITRFFGGIFVDKVVGHKIVRWVILVIFVAFISLSATYAAQITADQEEVQ